MSRDPRHLLLDLLWPRPGVAATPFTEAEWAAVNRMAMQHRLRPLLDVRVAGAEAGFGAVGAPPAEMLAAWHRATRRNAARALRQRTTLVRIGGWLAEAGIGAYVLKGGAFVWEGWFPPALRPMRDLDLLVADGQALAAHALLRARGFVGEVPVPGSVASGAAKHLPGLTGPDGVHVELHMRLIEVIGPTWRAREAAFRQGCVERASPMAGAIGRFTTTDTLLHLILHAVLDHRFNNGPLLLFDMEMLVRHGEIDWDAFWWAAETCGAVRAARLALTLVEARLPGLVAMPAQGMIAPAVAPEMAARAEMLMLVDSRQSSALGWPAALSAGGWQQAARRLGAMLSRYRQSLRKAADRPGNGGGKAGMGSVGGGGPIAPLRRLWSTLRPLGDRASRQHLRDSITVSRWLERD